MIWLILIFLFIGYDPKVTGPVMQLPPSTCAGLDLELESGTAQNFVKFVAY